MRRSLLLLIASGSLVLTGCADGYDEELAERLADVVQDEEAEVTQDEEAEDTVDDEEVLVPVEESTELVDADGTAVGTATFRDDDDRAAVEVEVSGLTAGYHPMYLYTGGTCEPDDEAVDGTAVRALPPLLVLEDGFGSITTLVGSTGLDQLLAGSGSALVIAPAVAGLGELPQAVDEENDLVTTGSLVACGVIAE